MSFISEVVQWLCDNGFSNLGVKMTSDFCYSTGEDTDFNRIGGCVINVGRDHFDEIDKWFEQFLYEYGLEWMDLGRVLPFIHELGHHNTIYSFSNSERLAMYYSKFRIFSNEDMTMEEMFEYWETPDEFAANIWAVNFTNKNISEVERLVNIFLKYQMM